MAAATLREREPFGVRIGADGIVRLSPGLASLPVIDATGTQIATVHGVVLQSWAGPGLTVGPKAIGADFAVTDEALFVRRVLHGLHGMFLAVTEGPLGRHLHLDFGGSIPAMWCEETGVVGASADQLLDDAAYRKRFLADRYERLVAREGHGWITGTLTAHRGVHRLMPGHALDLSTLMARRVWPLAGELGFDLGLDDAAERAGTAIRGLVEAAAREHRTAITMTAGFDSRILMAAARNVRDRIGFVTFGQPGEGLDQDMAAKMAAALGLTHALIPIRDAAAEDQARWDRLVGHCMREVNRRIHPTLAEVPYDFILTGMYGEIGRARLYRQDIETINDRPATAEFVLSRLTLPLDPEQVADVAKWVDGLSWMPRSMVLDMAFNELKFGSWAVGQSPAQKAIRFSMMPFAQAEVQAAFLRTPPAVKGTEALFTRMAERLWPEAMAFPVNRYGDWRDRFGRFAKLTKRESVVRYLRDRLAS
jgi:hypothetical protein